MGLMRARRSRAYHLFEILSDCGWVRVRVSLIGVAIGLGVVMFVSYTVCANHFLEQLVS